MNAAKRSKTRDESYFVASQWQLIWRKFRSHRLAILGAVILCLLYLFAIFSGFFSTTNISQRFSGFTNCPPHKIHFFDGKSFSLRPFVYAYKPSRDPVTRRQLYVEDRTQKFPIRFFARSEEYRFWGLFTARVRLFSVEEPGALFLFGTDELGRDLYSRVLHATRISLSIGLVGVSLSFVLGSILGGVSGYLGGTVDIVIQRIIEFLISIPTIPLWMALSAALPPKWPPLRVYFGITVILSIVGWCGLARVVRGKLLSLRGEDFVMAAKISGATDRRILFAHLLPSFISYLIIHLTLAIPSMILGETALSFLGLGLRPPVVSWGVLLSTAQNVRTVAHSPWLLIPGIYVIVTVLAFNFLGDGLRDAADPYK